ncbi:hypothetical protein D3C81_1264670 [compost metagenome]
MDAIHRAVHEYPELRLRRGAGDLPGRPGAGQRPVCAACGPAARSLGPVRRADHVGGPAGTAAGRRTRPLAGDPADPRGTAGPANDRQRAGRHVRALRGGGILRGAPADHAAGGGVPAGPAPGGGQRACRPRCRHCGGAEHLGRHRRRHAYRFRPGSRPRPGAHPGSAGWRGGGDRPAGDLAGHAGRQRGALERRADRPRHPCSRHIYAARPSGAAAARRAQRADHLL